jgi:hypothetical protein
LLESFQIENAHQRIAATNAVIEKGERFATGVAFDPERDAAQIHGERIFVHAINAMGYDIARGCAQGFGGGFIFACADARKLLAEPPSRRQQKMPRTAGRIANANRKNRLCGE